MVKRLKDLWQARKKGRQPEEVQVKRQADIRSKYDRLTEAMTFAEAGLTDHAQELMRQGKREPRKILVVAHGDGWPQPVLEYALELAERLGSALVMLNVVPVPGSLKEPVPLYKQHLLRTHEESARQAAQVYRQRAEARGIQVQQVVKFGDLKTALEGINREIRRIELVIASREVTKEKLEAGLNVPVFNII